MQGIPKLHEALDTKLLVKTLSTVEHLFQKKLFLENSKVLLNYPQESQILVAPSYFKFIYLPICWSILLWQPFEDTKLLTHLQETIKNQKAFIKSL